MSSKNRGRTSKSNTMTTVTTGAAVKLLMVCLGLTLSSASSPEDAVTGKARDTVGPCRCVPNQWRGALASTEREFDLKRGRSNLANSEVMVFYDYDRKRFAMVDPRTGARVIADYGLGYKFLIRQSMCHSIKTKEEMKQMCLPANAKYMGVRTIGANIPVVQWEFQGPFNISLKTSVVQENCVPLSEEIYMAREGFVSLTTSMYLDFVLGIEDVDVFTPPSTCRHSDRQNHVKRGAYGNAKKAWMIPRAFKNNMYSFK